MSTKKYVIQFLRYFTNRYVARIPFKGLRHFWYRRFFTLGKHSNIMMRLTIRNVRGISIGNTTNINPDCLLDSRGGKITIGDNVDVSPEVNVWTLQHDWQSPSFDAQGGDVTIEDFVWIGNRVTILPNVHVGKGAVIASGAVVTKNVPEWTLVGGVPAKEIAKRNQNQLPRRPYKPIWL